MFTSGLEDKSKKSKAERIAFDLLEYLDQINYNKYYDSMGSPGTRGGEKEKLFSDFSSQSIKAAQASPYDVLFNEQRFAVRLFEALMQFSCILGVSGSLVLQCTKTLHN